MSEEELIEWMRERLEWDDEDGEFRWKDGRRKGYPAGCFSTDGYLQLHIKGTVYRLHRLIWLYHNGSWPKVIDHIDGNRTNNRLANLRDGDHSQNNVNSDRVKEAANVQFKSDRNRAKPWQVKFVRLGQVIHQSHYATQHEAIEAANQYRATLEF